MGALNGNKANGADISKDENDLDDTYDKIEKEVVDKDLSGVVEEVITREKYKLSIDSLFKRYFTCFDDEYDELVKKMRRNGERKLKGELDLSKILKKVRNFNTAFDYLFSERQKFLFKFNDRHVIDSNSDLITPDSEESLFSGTSDEDLKNKSMK